MRMHREEGVGKGGSQDDLRRGRYVNGYLFKVADISQRNCTDLVLQHPGL
jgi:hypothetical protein